MRDDLFHEGTKDADGSQAAESDDSGQVRKSARDRINATTLFAEHPGINGLVGVLALLALSFIAYRPLLPGSFIMVDRKLIFGDNPLVSGTMSPLTIWFRMDFPL